MKFYHFFLALSMCFSSVAYADEGTSSQLQEEGPSLREPYPGEEVTNTESKTVRRWSTRGPVEVSRAPQPFDSPLGLDNQGRFPGGVLLNVDPSDLRQNNQGTYPSVRDDRPKGKPSGGYRPSK
jgi:hypothetical protein